jgi:hypothetical protein
VTTAEDCREWCGALRSLMVDRGVLVEHFMLFNVPAVRDAHATLEKLASTDVEANRQWHNVRFALQRINFWLAAKWLWNSVAGILNIVWP